MEIYLQAASQGRTVKVTEAALKSCFAAPPSGERLEVLALKFSRVKRREGRGGEGGGGEVRGLVSCFLGFKIREELIAECQDNLRAHLGFFPDVLAHIEGGAQRCHGLVGRIGNLVRSHTRYSRKPCQNYPGKK